jgi:gas vesicle protein
MATEDTLGKSDGQIEPIGDSRGPGGFTAGLLLGVILGAAAALLFAPEQGQKTRGRLRRRVKSLGEDAWEGIDKAGARTRKELIRRKRRLREELERVKERAKDALD